MKYLFAAFLFTISYHSFIQAQTMSQSFGNTGVFIPGSSPFSTIQLTGGNYFQKANLVSNNDIILPSYNLNGAGANNTFFSNDWVKGSVTTTTNQTYSDGLLFMLDKVKCQLYFKQIDSAAIMEADMSKISLFSLITDKQHIFIKGDLLSHDFKGDIFEILVLGEKKITLLKSILSVYNQPSAKSAAQIMTQAETTGSYTDNPVYYIYSNNNLQKTELKKKSFLKALGTDELKAELYIQSHHGNFSEAYAINLITFLNQ